MPSGHTLDDREGMQPMPNGALVGPASSGIRGQCSGPLACSGPLTRQVGFHQAGAKPARKKDVRYRVEWVSESRIL